MRKIMFYICVLSASLNALAHFEIGTYAGKNLAGESCQFQIKSVAFDNDFHHPLNEKVLIEIPQVGELVFSHLAIVDSETKTVRPKKEVLSAVVPNRSGASAWELVMNHDGPVKFLNIEDNYKDSTKNILGECGDLKFSQK